MAAEARPISETFKVNLPVRERKKSPLAAIGGSPDRCQNGLSRQAVIPLAGLPKLSTTSKNILFTSDATVQEAEFDAERTELRSATRSAVFFGPPSA